MRKLSIWLLCLTLLCAMTFGAAAVMAEETEPQDLTKALAEAVPGQTVTVKEDTQVLFLSVPNEVTLDLNGKTLTATYVSAFGNIEDSSAENTGLLKVDANKLLLKTTNSQLPVKTAEGYKFISMRGFNTRVLDGGARYVFQPLFEAAAHEMLKDGAAATGVSVQVLVTWKSGADTDSRTFVFGDNFVTQFVNSYVSTGGYGKMFQLTVSNPEKFEDLQYTAMVVTESGVTYQPAKLPAEVTEDVTLQDGQNSALVSAGTKLTDGDVSLSLVTTEMENTTSSIVVGEGETARSMDIHVNGLSKDNTVPVIVTINEMAPEFMNRGNITLYHVENGEAIEMTRVYSVDEVNEHNEYYYDIETGTVTMALKSFSEIAAVSNIENGWNGEFDYSWYTDAVALTEAEGEADYTIANADQLAAFGAIVGGMNGQTQNSFKGKTVKLISDINLGDKETENNPDIIFYPIGYYNSDGTYEKTGKAITSGLRNFEGTFDGNGHTVSNFYQNTWEMKGDHDWYTPEEQYYRDGMGLFGRVYGGTIKNLTVKNFTSDGEIATTGCIAAYADHGATFENIAIFNCNPRVYNIGNGGIVGCVGWYNKGVTDKKVTFKNITVDNSNKISALWGSYDVACGGIVGQYYPTSGQSSADYPVNAGIDLINCHVAAQMDVYNDVCANYQYYAYRYTGMLIGSVRENVNGDGTALYPETGRVYPKMDGITASGCTVHFGTWNDYYYCEIIDNTTASYTHDYQMSRLAEIKAIDGTTITYLDGTTGTVPASGRANYVIVDYTKGHGTDNATCHHFKDGAVWTHDMGGIQTGIDENGDGQDDLKEDKQHIYLEFNNLVTGYGWGVTSKGLTDLKGVEILDITQGEHEKSVVKFEAVNDTTEFEFGSVVTIGKLFAAKENTGVDIDIDNVQVTVSPADKSSTVVGTYVANTTDWTQGALTFSGTGAATVTITDYYFCTPTTITVTVKERQSVEKFETKFTGDFLYRVGNASGSTVTLGTLFTGTDVKSASVDVNFETVAGNASGTYNANITDWTAGTIQFAGTGVVKVTITDNDYCIATELLLEVVDATNITSAKGTTSGGDMVLLCDVNTSTYVNYWNCTLWGNGFTYSLNGAPTAYNSKQGKGILITKNATLDNLKIVGDIYTAYGAYTNQDYFNTAIDVIEDTTIQNCYIANCAAPVRARNNVTIKNTTLYGGAVANLIIESGTVTLEDVTTANYDDGREVVGLGIVVHSDATEAAKLVLNGTLKQYNFISESKVPTDTYAKNIHSAMFGTSCSKYHFGTSPNCYVNTGVVSMTAEFNADDITDNANTGYVGSTVTLSSIDGYVYTQLNTSGSVNNNFPEYKSTTKGAVPPSYSFDYTDKNYLAKTEGTNDYCYEENGTVNISMDEGDTFNWDTSILTIGKGITNYTVSMNGTDYTGMSIAFNTADDYTVTYCYTDNNNFKLDENGNITTYSVTYTKTVNITVAVVKATTKHAEFTFGSSNTASTTVTVGNSTYVMPNVSGASSAIGSTTVSGEIIYYPIVEIIMSDGKKTHTSGWYAYFPVFSGAVTITDYADNGTGDKMTPYDGSTTTMPTGLSVVGDAKTLFKYQSGSNAGETPVVKNNILVYSSAKIEANREDYNTVVQYTYTDNAGATYHYYIGYHAPKQTYSPGCFTPDTLITLADGTQKRVDQLGFDDKILAWDFFAGTYVAQDISLLVNHGESLYKVANLQLSDGTVLRLIADHGVFDYDLNKYVYITVDNMHEYIGHRFVQYAAGGSYNVVTLTDAFETEEYTSAWSVSSAGTSNAFASGMLTVAPPEDFYNWIEMGDKLMYNVEKFQQDVETYGLYTYEDFQDYVTYEQFVAWNGAYLKIAVEKGYFTFEYILELIDLYKGWMPTG